ncbi:alpha/beta hydrolase [Rugosimonospora acidiphila]|uniref:Alpha/beta hydrolase n=1 Tax=Rugosimonospora acidiphila TaxID=556531 RepID=A0ABP9RL14_9ACTN
MTSLLMRAVAGYVRLTAKPRFATVAGARRMLAAAKGPSQPPARLGRRHRVSRRQVNGFDCWTVAPNDRPATRAVIYLHGGGYVNEIVSQHWALISRLARAGVRVEVPIYGLAPRHTYRDAYPLVTEVYRDLIGEVDAATVSIAGDSAGAGLALGFAQTLAGAGLPGPGRLVLISPWLDLTLSNPDLPAVEARDPWLARAGLIEIGTVWAGGDDPEDPRLSPVNGPLAGLPPTDVYVGSRDLSLPDAELLRTRAEAEGWQLTTTVGEGAVHVYPLVPAPEGRNAADAIVKSLSAA